MSRGDLTMDQVRAFALQHYQLVKVFPKYITSLMKTSGPGEISDKLREVLADEYGGVNPSESHPRLYEKFLLSVGVPRKTWDFVNWAPGTDRFVATHWKLTRRSSLWVGMGAMGPGHEWSLPTMFGYLRQGLEAWGQVSRDDMEYFHLHIEQDKEHGRIFSELIGKYATGGRAWEDIQVGAHASLDARRCFWDDLLLRVFPSDSKAA